MSNGGQDRGGVRKALLLPFILFLVPTSACIQTAALWTNITGGDVITPEFTLTKGPLLILIDDPNNLVTRPRAIRKLHKEISDRFLEYRVNARVIPFNDWQRLQQTEREYDKMTIREIGAKLGAEQVLYFRVDRFTLHAEPGAPLFKGEFSGKVKVLSTQRKHDVRLWPRERSGRRVSARTKAQSMEGGKSASQIAEILATKLGQKVSELFYEHREFAE